MPLSDKLDPSDAKVVDVLHTDENEFGIGKSCGTIDFYANGGQGKNQPTCKLYSPLLEVGKEHIKSYAYNFTVGDLNF